MWQYTGKTRPSFADEPGPRQESVWDYPRPPAIVAAKSLVTVRATGRLLASTRCALRVIETASPPTYYLPITDVDREQLVRAKGRSYCEWKGEASYWSLATDPDQLAVGRSYAAPSAGFIALQGYVAFYPGRVACFVDDERVQPQPGSFYGGWVTSEIAGPFKGADGNNHW